MKKIKLYGKNNKILRGKATKLSGRNFLLM